MTFDPLQVLIGIICFAAAIWFLLFALQSLRGDTAEYERNQRRSGGFWQVLGGRVPAYRNGRRDYRVAAGIAIDTEKNELIDQGRLSDEALEAALAPRHL